MIAFGCAISEPEAYIRYAQPGIRLAAEAGSEIFAFAWVETISRSYNLLLEAAAAREDLEALVLVHPHAQIDDPDLCQKVRRAFADPELAVVGCAGARGVQSIAWWEGKAVCGPVTHRYTDHGGGDLPAFAWASPDPGPGEVEAVDGFLLVLSPWAVRSVRFDEELVLGHGYDVDFCRQVRAAGRKVAVADLKVIEHLSLEIVSDVDLWTEAHAAAARKWARELSAAGADEAAMWKLRARRAEAEREAARAIAYFHRLGYDARIEALEQSLEQATSTVSWRVTAPLRWLNQWRREKLARGQNRAA